MMYIYALVKMPMMPKPTTTEPTIGAQIETDD